MQATLRRHCGALPAFMQHFAKHPIPTTVEKGSGFVGVRVRRGLYKIGFVIVGPQIEHRILRVWG